jgi:ornithine cyclodeaminase/alanine dehydrogenase-like protein (mu-crystallin family)
VGSGVPMLSGKQVRDAVPWRAAVGAIERALLDRSAPGRTPLRSSVPVHAGELLIMPSEVGSHVGVKVLSVRAEQGRRETPRVQGVHLVLDAETLSPVALLEAAALTLVRTAAVSAAAVHHLAGQDASRLVVFGSGPQAWSHVQALDAVRPLSAVVVVGRDAGRAAALVERCRRRGLDAVRGEPAAVASADLVACCTSAATPLFDSALLPDHATVVAMGSHHADAREVDTALVRRATVVVETRESALKEAGDILLAVADGVPLEEAVDGDLPALLHGEVPLEPHRPRLFKGVGEAWSDVVIAAEVLRWAGPTGPGPAPR